MTRTMSLQDGWGESLPRPPRNHASRTTGRPSSNARARSIERRRPNLFRPVAEPLEERRLLNVQWHGGPTVEKAEIYVIFLGSQWNTDSNLRALKGYIDQYVLDLSDSFPPFVNQTTGFEVPIQPDVSSGTFAGDLTAPLNLGSVVSDQTIRGIVPLPPIPGPTQPADTSRVYFVMPPPGVVVTFGSANSVYNFYGYHSYVGRKDAGSPYMVIPFPGTSTYGNAHITGLNYFDQMTEVMSHELAEALTDPYGDGYYDNSRINNPQGPEIGDIYNAWTYTAQLHPGGASKPILGAQFSDWTYMLQVVYSNTAEWVNGGFQGGPVKVHVTDSAANLTPSGSLGLTGPGPTHGTIGGRIGSFSATFSGASAADFSASINWGDGTTSPATIQNDGSGQFSVVAATPKTYAQPGNYIVAQTITDSVNGRTFFGFSDVAISDTTLTASNPEIHTGVPFSGDVATFRSSDPNAKPGSFSAQIDWGDTPMGDEPGEGVPPSTGQVTLGPDGTFHIAGNHTYSQPGTYSISVTLSDSSQGTTPVLSGVTDSVTVAAEAPPQANDDKYTVTAGQTIHIPAPGVLANDQNPNGLPLQAVLKSPPLFGQLTLNSDGSFTYTAPNYPGGDIFSYAASDGQTTSNAAEVDISILPPTRHVAPTDDYDGDGKTDIAVFRPDSDIFDIQLSGGGSISQQWGWVGHDQPIQGDFDGDGKTDIAVFRPQTATFYIKGSSGRNITQQWGWPMHDQPVTGDFDGDGKTDIAVFRPQTATFYILESSGGTVVQQWGWPMHDQPITGDFDGDGKTDIAVFRPQTATFYIKGSLGRNTTQQWGWVGHDEPVVGDFDGDGKTDIAVFRPDTATFYVLGSTGQRITHQWGWVGHDKPVIGDFDGDGKTDIAVFRPDNSTFYVAVSSGGSLVKPYGSPGLDWPL